MRCGLDPACWAWQFVLGLPWWVHVGVLLCIALMLWGVAARLWTLAQHIGGWQAAVGAVGILALIVAALYPKAGAALRAQWGTREDPDFAPPIPIPKPRPRRKTLIDLLRGNK